jgi:hypothetical protein
MVFAQRLVPYNLVGACHVIPPALEGHDLG